MVSNLESGDIVRPCIIGYDWSTWEVMLSQFWRVGTLDAPC